jgi:1,4-dihydroxy-2-naphthoyl-CoA hydrolase
MYKNQTVVRLHHTDAAGIIYFTSIFVLAHECYESFLEQGSSIRAILDDGEYLIPIVHAEADYKKPLKVSDKVSIEMSLSKMSKSSFELSYTFFNESTEIAATAKTVHVVIGRSTQRGVEIPQFLKTTLSSLQ